MSIARNSLDAVHEVIFDHMPAGWRVHFYHQDALIQKAKPFFTVFGGAIAAYLAAKWTLSLGKAFTTYCLAVPLNLGADVRKAGDWAVIGGANDGIGKEYAFQLAEKGLNIVLVARNTAKTEAVARELDAKYGVKTIVLSIDIGKLDPAGVENLRRDLQDLDIAILINSAAVPAPSFGKFLVCGSEQDSMNSVDLNARGTMLMCRAILPLMLAKKKEGQKRYVINVGAILGSVNPSPGQIVYGATKAFLDSFSIALNHEYKDEGIEVQSYLPGATLTPMMPPDLASNFWVVKPHQGVAASLAHLGVKTRTFGYWKHAATAWWVSWNKVNEIYVPHV